MLGCHVFQGRLSKIEGKCLVNLLGRESCVSEVQVHLVICAALCLRETDEKSCCGPTVTTELTVQQPRCAWSQQGTFPRPPHCKSRNKSSLPFHLLPFRLRKTANLS